MTGSIEVAYNTTNEFKRREASYLFGEFELNGVPIRDIYEVRFTSAKVKETLEVDIEAMVKAEAISAYSGLQIPCIVEHAGLVFDEYAETGYPGGLTKPMWNSLGDKFLDETRSIGRRVVARAVIGYCDGQDVHTFVGETKGKLAEPHGDWDGNFYWDTVFVPEDGNLGEKTYAQIVADEGIGAKLKVSQSARAMLKFLAFRKANPPRFWDITF